MSNKKKSWLSSELDMIKQLLIQKFFNIEKGNTELVCSTKLIFWYASLMWSVSLIIVSPESF